MFYRETRNSLVKFLKRSVMQGEQVNPAWLSCLPLVHYFEGTLQPFVSLDLRRFEITDTKQDSWWCFSEFKDEKEEMKHRDWKM